MIASERTGRSRLLVAMTITLSVVVSRCQTPGGGEITLTLSSGKSYSMRFGEVRDGGRGEEDAKELNELAIERDLWGARHENQPNSASTLQAINDLRDTAILNLVEVYNTAKITGIPLEQQRLKLSTNISDSLLKSLQRDIAPRLYVQTRVRATVQEYAIWYLSDRDYKTRTGHWATYGFRQRLHIGGYYFMVTPGARPGAPAPGPYSEYVVVFDDPTEKLLRYESQQK